MQLLPATSKLGQGQRLILPFTPLRQFTDYPLAFPPDKVYPSCLMAHLRCCHPRFRFSGSWQRETSHLVLEVTLDESYDGSNDCVPRTYRPSTTSAPDNGVDVCLTETSASRNPHHLPLVGGWTGYCGEAENNLRDARKLATSRFLQRRRRQPLKRLPFSQLIYWRGVERFSGSSQEVGK